MLHGYGTVEAAEIAKAAHDIGHGPQCMRMVFAETLDSHMQNLLLETECLRRPSLFQYTAAQGAFRPYDMEIRLVE